MTVKLTELLTKKDFLVVANALADAHKAIDLLRVSHSLGSAQLNRIFISMAKDISLVLSKTNPRFNEDKFMAQVTSLRPEDKGKADGTA